MRRMITNPELLEAIRFLKVKSRKEKVKIWETAAEQLSRPRGRRAVLDLNHISRASSKDSVVLVPGRVLGDGILKHPVTIGAFHFSQTAKTKIEQAGGKCVTLQDLASKYPKGSKIQILR
jgi:large subunit ribosomal protein L18e